jgi:very-long-chain enoyl-CoA reductase
MVQYKVISKSGEILTTIESNTVTTVADFKQAVADSLKKNIYRVRLSYEDKVLESSDRALLAFIPSTNANPTILFKDLGPQMWWRSVFIIEYAGPIVISALIYFFAPYIHRQADKSYITTFQKVNILFFISHFIKRELETVFVHKFSADTMPIRNLFKNSLFYYVFAVFASYYLTHPLYTKPSLPVFLTGLAVFVLSEGLNGYCHWKLSSLRPTGTRVRQVPRGPFFDQIVAPNYTFEVLSWGGFTLMSGLWVIGGAFTAASAAILTSWATARKHRYMKEFDGIGGRDLFPKNRWVIFPGVY